MVQCMVTRFELHGMTLSEYIAIKASINVFEMNLLEIYWL
jgi:hypothetical protein